MSLLSWNCRRLGRPQELTVQRLTELRRMYFPEILFLMETMNSRSTIEDLKVWLGYDNVFTVNPVNSWGREGGGV